MRQICFTAGVIFEYYDENLENPWRQCQTN